MDNPITQNFDIRAKDGLTHVYRDGVRASGANVSEAVSNWTAERAEVVQTMADLQGGAFLRRLAGMAQKGLI